MTHLKMTLKENSLSFLRESLGNAIQAESDVGRWKFAVLMLVQAIETILKEKLRQTHEVFVYSNIDKPKHTVDVRLALERLRTISKINFKDSDIEYINAALKLRNQVVHFEFDLSIDQIKSNYVSLVGFYIAFCNQHLNIDIIPELSGSLEKEILNLESYVSELEARAIDRIEKESIPEEEIYRCPACHKDTFVVYDAADKCYLCGHYEGLVECEDCGILDFIDNMEDVDFGNMKGIENYKRFCATCFFKLEKENPYEEYY